jgi:hypothetical protein
LLYPKGDAARGSEQEEAALTYYTNVGPLSGPLLAKANYRDIRVSQSRENPTLIGVALITGQDQRGRSLWQLTIDTIELPGPFAVIDPQFRAAK